MKKYLLTFAFFFAAFAAFSQDNPVKWTYSVEQSSGSSDAKIILSAQIRHNYVMYSQTMPKDGPLPTEITFAPSANYDLIGTVSEDPKPFVKFDEGFQMDVNAHKNKVNFVQKIKIKAKNDFQITGKVDYQVCSGMMCMPFDTEFSVLVKGKGNENSNTNDSHNNPSSEDTVSATLQLHDSTTFISDAFEIPEGTKTSNLIWFILLAIAAGFAAVLTPCVFPMIPMTVSFFIGGSGKKSTAFLKGLIFGFSIALIYTLLGVIVALTKSANVANVISTHWISNWLFFLLFIIFAASFFGLFEITILSGFSNKMDRKADKGGLISAFFMALVMTIVSFSCTGPFVASLLVEAAFGANFWKPILGMFAFGLAMGTPFILLSFFPSLLKKLPKSGAWLNSVKVVFAFILLAFSLKFLLTIDMVYGFNFFTRNVYLAIWIVIFTLMGFYLLGKIKFSHDSEVKHIGVFRLTLVIAVFSFVIYLFTGLFGAKLENISGLLPPPTEILQNVSATSSETKSAATPNIKYSDKFHLPEGRSGFFEYAEGVNYAKSVNKPILLVFKGHGCSVCKQMEGESWGKPEIATLLDKYVIIALYCDDRTELPENEWITSKVDGKVKKTIGQINSDFEISCFKSNQLPLYAKLSAESETIIGETIGYAKTKEFQKFLEDNTLLPRESSLTE
ncbi:MAG: DUF255 domain-containing protein [Bacteroidales bacterium]|jgi:thiol:disulfide interchange protein DsbD|nr:DUF255 domain-containing protein [Bacteroidales bacterium]